MAAQKGRLILLKVGNGASPQIFSTIGGIRSRTISINNDTVDVTTSDEAPWRQFMGNTGMRSVSLSGSGVFKDEAAINAIEDLAFNGNLQEFQVVFGNGDIIQGVFAIPSFEYSGDHTAEQTYSISMDSAGICTMSRA